MFTMQYSLIEQISTMTPIVQYNTHQPASMYHAGRRSSEIYNKKKDLQLVSKNLSPNKQQQSSSTSTYYSSAKNPSSNFPAKVTSPNIIQNQAANNVFFT
jgi:hypothetical protein